MNSNNSSTITGSLPSINHSLKYLFIAILVVSFCFYLKSTNIHNSILYWKKTKSTRVNAFIVSLDCNSPRFHFTKENIQRVFPNFFNIHCFKPISLNDSRIGNSIPLLQKKLASNLISFVTLWTYELINYSSRNDLDWSFIFEDDVDFIDPSKFSMPNYAHAVQEMMRHPEIQLKDGVFYLGICGARFGHINNTLIISGSNNSLISRKGCGRCVHAMALTIRRAKTFWVDISLYYPLTNGPADIYIDNHCSKTNKYYILGANMQWPPGTGHYGIAFQDRKRFRSQVW